MGVDAATFRSVLGQWPSGVTVVTTVVDGGWHGMTASSFSSVSLDPPLVSVCLAKAVWTHGLVGGQRRLRGEHPRQGPGRRSGMLFAGQRPEVADRFEGLAARAAVTGAPVLTEALGWLDCRVVQAYDGGDHTIFVGEVVDADTPRLTAPLLFHSRAWGQFADLLPGRGAGRGHRRRGGPARPWRHRATRWPRSSGRSATAGCGSASPTWPRRRTRRRATSPRPEPYASTRPPPRSGSPAPTRSAWPSGWAPGTSTSRCPTATPRPRRSCSARSSPQRVRLASASGSPCRTPSATPT